jgi:hypothetical protein
MIYTGSHTPVYFVLLSHNHTAVCFTFTRIIIRLIMLLSHCIISWHISRALKHGTLKHTQPSQTGVETSGFPETSRSSRQHRKFRVQISALISVSSPYWGFSWHSSVSPDLTGRITTNYAAGTSCRIRYSPIILSFRAAQFKLSKAC